MLEELLSEPESIAYPKLVHPSFGPVPIRLQEVICEFNVSNFSVEKTQPRSGMLDVGNFVQPDSAHIVSRKLQMGGVSGVQAHKSSEP